MKYMERGQPLAGDNRDRHLQETPIAHNEAYAASSPALAMRATFFKSFVYAGRGVVYALRTQRNMRVHLLLFAIALLLGVALRLSSIEFALVFVVATGVLVTEMMNTYVEACVDLITREYHPLARVAKDVAAGAVLVNAALAVIVACFIYIPHLWPLLLHLASR